MKGRSVMYNKQAFLFWGLFLSVFMLGCVTISGNLETYKPKSDTESQIKKSLLDYEKAFNARDLEQCLSHFHENAQIKPSTFRTTIDSKSKIAEFLEDRWSWGTRFTGTSAPEITVNGDQAFVKIRRLFVADEVSGSTDFGITMVRSDGGRWLIKSQTMDIHYI